METKQLSKLPVEKVEKKVKKAKKRKLLDDSNIFALGFTRVNWGKKLQDSPYKLSLGKNYKKIRFAASYAKAEFSEYMSSGKTLEMDIFKTSVGYNFRLDEDTILAPVLSHFSFVTNGPHFSNKSVKDIRDINDLERRSGVYPGLVIIQQLSPDVQVAFEGYLGLFFGAQVGLLF